VGGKFHLKLNIGGRPIANKYREGKMQRTLKREQELIGEVIGLLQSPAKNVISALKGSGQKIAGLLKTLSEREG